MKDRLIFIVDDDKIIQNLLDYTFKSREGYNVEVFPTGEDCIANLNLNPDIIVLDYLFMSNDSKLMSGLDILEEIRKVNKEIPVFILSSQPSSDLINEFLKKGANGYISKEDYFIDTLIESIDKLPLKENIWEILEKSISHNMLLIIVIISFSFVFVKNYFS